MESPSGVALPQSPVDEQVATDSGHRVRAHARHAAPVRVGAGARQGDRVVARRQRHGRRHGREDGPDPLHGQSRVDPPDCARLTRRPPAADVVARGVVPIGPNDAVDEAPNNLAVTQLYEPGSVFKLVTFSAALQDGLINPNSIFTVPDQITSRRLDVPRRRAAPDRDADRHPDPGPVLQHRDIGDRAGCRRAAPARPGQDAGLRAADRARTSPGSRRGSWPPPPSGSRPTTSRCRSGRSTPSTRCRCSTPTTRWPTAASFVAPEAGPGDGQPVGHRCTQTPPSATHEVVLALGRRGAHVHARAGGVHRHGYQRRRARLHRGRKDRARPRSPRRGTTPTSRVPTWRRSSGSPRPSTRRSR